MAELLSIERRGGVALVTLERPEKRNALSIELRLELAEAFGGLDGDDSVGAVVLTGAGSAFCSGMDLTQFGGDAANRRRLVETSTAAFRAVGSCRRPVLAAINGPALAGGFALALLCDLRIAAAGASFGFPELPRGIPASYASARQVLPAAVAADLCLTGRIVDAGEALRLGVVGEVVADEALLERSLAIATAIAAAPRGAGAETKRRILVEREQHWRFAFEEEERVFRQALLGDEA
ncbi:MAG: enoyl-CoA hydratase [Solirubrobacterales bacterium]|nr:enoyl-CoA hydratase [Solirubrobacterales bacterium]